MEEKGLTFFNNLIEENLQKVMAKYGAKETEKAFQIGYLKGALAMEMWKNQFSDSVFERNGFGKGEAQNYTESEKKEG